MKLAAFSGVFIEHSIQEAMQMTKRLGLEGIEIAVREPHLTPSSDNAKVEEIKALAQSLALEIPVLASYIGGFTDIDDAEAKSYIEEFKRLLEIAGRLGTGMIRVFPGGPNAFMANDDHYARAAYWMNLCAEEAAKYKVNVLMEIHNDSLVETVEGSLRLLGLIGSDNIGMIHDAGNMYITDTDYGRDSVLKLGSRLMHVHVKDELRIAELGAPGTFASTTRHGRELFVQSRLGEGGADHGPLFKALRETGYTGWTTLECHAPFPAYERLEHDLRVVRKLIAES